jgi:NAD(P)-dependent dehydrogenase (short-subunit alcohol dehydrogenase family)
MATGRKVALVTGAGRGIGLAIAKALAKDGCDLVVNDVHEPGDVAGALGDLKALGAEAVYARADVSTREGRAAMIDEARRRFGRLNVLVNNAGVAPKVRADILEASEESFDRVLSINLRGPYFLTQAAANWMVAQKKADPAFAACVVNVASVSAFVASPSRGEYCISKAGVSMATKLWAARLGEFDIPVYEIQPGIIQTDMTAVVKEKYDKLIGEGLCLQKRWGFPEDVARAAAMLVRGDCAYSTGLVVTVDGGMTLQRL